MAFGKGEKNINSKLTWEDVKLITELREYKDNRIAEIDIEIESLQKEKKQLRHEVSKKQLAFKFDVSERTITYLFSGDQWGSK